jgi:arginyl-tRNA--protein-N-Asp/Glu arginylyltransferase
MISLCRFIAPPSRCGYLPDQVWSLEYDVVAAATPADYFQRMVRGWRRFGDTFFRPRCPSCRRCQSLRVVAAEFRPNRSQRRTRAANEATIRLRRGLPEVTRGKLQLYDRYHAFQSGHKGWPQHPAKDAASYAHSFVENPFPTEEWCYYLQDKLVGVGYVDVLPGGLSAIYFFYDPDERHRSLGTWNVLCLIDEARRRRLPHVYLGYYVAGCPSMTYKASFRPHQLLGPDGVWRDAGDNPLAQE